VREPELPIGAAADNRRRARRWIILVVTVVVCLALSIGLGLPWWIAAAVVLGVAAAMVVG
jgi:hypothetical protein